MLLARPCTVQSCLVCRFMMESFASCGAIPEALVVHVSLRSLDEFQMEGECRYLKVEPQCAGHAPSTVESRSLFHLLRRPVPLAVNEGASMRIDLPPFQCVFVDRSPWNHLQGELSSRTLPRSDVQRMRRRLWTWQRLHFGRRGVGPCSWVHECPSDAAVQVVHRE